MREKTGMIGLLAPKIAAGIQWGRQAHEIETRERAHDDLGQVAALENVEDGGLAEGQRVVEDAALASGVAGNAIALARASSITARMLSHVCCVARSAQRRPMIDRRPLLHHG